MSRIISALGAGAMYSQISLNDADNFFQFNKSSNLSIGYKPHTDPVKL